MTPLASSSSRVCSSALPEGGLLVRAPSLGLAELDAAPRRDRRAATVRRLDASSRIRDGSRPRSGTTPRNASASAPAGSRSSMPKRRTVSYDKALARRRERRFGGARISGPGLATTDTGADRVRRIPEPSNRASVDASDARNDDESGAVPPRPRRRQQPPEEPRNGGTLSGASACGRRRRLRVRCVFEAAASRDIREGRHTDEPLLVGRGVRRLVHLGRTASTPASA